MVLAISVHFFFSNTYIYSYMYIHVVNFVIESTYIGKEFQNTQKRTIITMIILPYYHWMLLKLGQIFSLFIVCLEGSFKI